MIPKEEDCMHRACKSLKGVDFSFLTKSKLK